MLKSKCQRLNYKNTDSIVSDSSFSIQPLAFSIAHSSQRQTGSQYERDRAKHFPLPRQWMRTFAYDNQRQGGEQQVGAEKIPTGHD